MVKLYEIDVNPEAENKEDILSVKELPRFKPHYCRETDTRKYAWGKPIARWKTKGLLIDNDINPKDIKTPENIKSMASKFYNWLCTEYIAGVYGDKDGEMKEFAFALPLDEQPENPPDKLVKKLYGEKSYYIQKSTKRGARKGLVILREALAPLLDGTSFPKPIQPYYQDKEFIDAIKDGFTRPYHPDIF